jgi:hypothetical protein
MESTNFYNELTNIISTFPDRSRMIVERRLGFNGISDSLESIGQDLSVTRERVRQIESACLHTINKSCGVVLTKKLKKLLNKRKTALYMTDLQQEDEWFQGFSERTVFLGHLIEKLTTYHVFTINDEFVITQIHRDQWSDLKAETIEALKEKETERLSQAKVKQFVRNLASDQNAGELSQLLYESIEDKLHYASPQGKGAKVLCSVGRGLSNILTALLVEATEPLHYTELAKRCSDVLGRHVEGYVHNSLKDLAYLYGRGIYGTLDHFPAINKKEILTATEKIISQGPQERQWSCSELLSKLKNKHQHKGLNKYTLNIILSESKKLKSVGRLMWIKKRKTGDVSRVDLQETVTNIIRTAKNPVYTNEIKDLILKQRGLDEYFTILPTEEIARIKPNLWGLVERDFLLKKTERQQMINVLLQILEQRQEGLHISELKNILLKENISLPDEFSNYMAMSLAQTDSRLKVRRGQILGLANWKDGKRITIREAVEEVAKNLTVPMTMLELRTQVEKIVKHEVKQPLHRLLENANLIRDEQLNTWYKQAA